MPRASSPTSGASRGTCGQSACGGVVLRCFLSCGWARESELVACFDAGLISKRVTQIRVLTYHTNQHLVLARPFRCFFFCGCFSLLPLQPWLSCICFFPLLCALGQIDRLQGTMSPEGEADGKGWRRWLGGVQEPLSPDPNPIRVS